MGERSRTGPGGWWQSVTRWAAAPEEEIDAERLRESARSAGYATLSDVADRERATVRGILQTVTLQPRAGMPALEAELYDGSGVVTLIWLGRRRIGGIDCGRKLVATGRVTVSDGRRVIYNPRYQLLPVGVA